MARKPVSIAALSALTYAELRAKFDHAVRRLDAPAAYACRALLCSAADNQHQYRDDALMRAFGSAQG